jgi:hypothetical protein
MRRFGHFSEVKGETNIEEHQMKKRLSSSQSLAQKIQNLPSNIGSSKLNSYMDELLNLPEEIGIDDNGNYVDAKTLNSVNNLPNEIG